MTDTATETFWGDVLEAAGDEPIEAVVIGTFEYGTNSERVPAEKIGVVISAAEAADLLSYSYDDGYGGEECHPIHAYTATRVLVIGWYDGLTYVTSVPRNPTDGDNPALIGGG